MGVTARVMDSLRQGFDGHYDELDETARLVPKMGPSIARRAPPYSKMTIIFGRPSVNVTSQP